MIWSKLYSGWKTNHLDERLLKRVNITRARYRNSHDAAMVALYVVFDKVTVLTEHESEWPLSGVYALNTIVVGDTLDNLLIHPSGFVRGLTYLDKRFGKSRIHEKILTEGNSFARDCLKLKMSLYQDLAV
jgi:hypothetical protein